jgi:DNA primase
MASISDDKVEEVRAASDLVDVVSDYVRLKKQGARFVGLCPFHSERTPSFSVDPQANLYHCFGCKAGGDVYRFVMDKEGVGFPDAVRLLADRAGIALPEDDGPGPEADEREAVLAALRFAARFYHGQLRGPAGARALEYLASRGFTKESVLAFGIGYAVDEWDALTRAATAAGHRVEILERAGLSRRRAGGGDGHYDVFRHRLIFPIQNAVGKVLGFGGRAMPGGRPLPDGTEPAKYINTAETPVYHKAEVLYGLKQAKHAIRAAEEAVLVEGYADVISLHQAGIRNAVAASGTALTAQQVRLLKTYARSVVLLYDSDAAGQSAAARGIEAVLDGGLAVSLVTLPDGADPDSFVTRFGAEAFAGYLERERQDFPAFIAAAAKRAGLLTTPEGKAEAAHRLMEAVGRVRDPVAQDAYMLRAAEVLGVPDATLRQLLRQRRRPPGAGDRLAARASSEGAAPPPSQGAAPAMRPEEGELLRLMLREGTAMVEHVLSRMAVDEFSEGPVRAAVAALITQYEAGHMDPEALVRGDYGGDVQSLAAEVLSERHVVSRRGASKRGVEPESRDARPFEAATSAMRFLKLDRLDEALADVRRQIYAAEQGGSDATELYRRVTALTELRSQVERGTFLEWNAS